MSSKHHSKHLSNRRRIGTFSLVDHSKHLSNNRRRIGTSSPALSIIQNIYRTVEEEQEFQPCLVDVVGEGKEFAAQS